MLEIKRGLNEDIRMIMSNSINERLEPTLWEKLKEQQIQLVHNVSGRLEQLLENKISRIKESTSASREILSTQYNTLNDLLICSQICAWLEILFLYIFFFIFCTPFNFFYNCHE
tara:strand:+ start:1932 stop:2273 length:342 start_codon:yes stop_codon:yes gene_type:complete